MSVEERSALLGATSHLVHAWYRQRSPWVVPGLQPFFSGRRGREIIQFSAKIYTPGRFRDGPHGASPHTAVYPTPAFEVFMKSYAACFSTAVVALALGCANVVIVPGESSESTSGGGSGSAGQGGAGQGGSTASGTTDPPPGWDGCPSQCSGPSTSTTCSCAVSCDGLSKISCAPSTDLQGNTKIECVCTYDELFSGVCYETNSAAMCDPHAGCCFKYFQSTG
jgi:hypothetical protein